MRRRTLLATVAAAIAVPSGWEAWAEEPKVREEDREVFDKIRDLLKKAGTAPLKSSSTAHYLCGGDIPVEDRLRVGRYCEALLVQAMGLFALLGFAPQRPERRLTIVALGQRETFAQIANAAGSDAGRVGFYDPSIRTAFFFLHYRNGTNGPIDWEASLRAAGHEAMHQICFNSGVLNSKQDVPSCVGEGLAILGEGGSNETSSLLSRHHPDHFSHLTEESSSLPFGLTRFFREDEILQVKNNPGQVQKAYAQAWLLVGTLLTEPDLRPKFAAYLKEIHARTDKEHRLEDAQAHLGDLAVLETRLERRLRKMNEHPPSIYAPPRRRSARR